MLDILEAIADARDEDVTALPSMIEFFDPQPLNQFVESTDVPTTIILDAYGCQVRIDGQGDVIAIEDGRRT